jgi:hypothetical protein
VRAGWKRARFQIKKLPADPIAIIGAQSRMPSSSGYGALNPSS